MREVKIYFSDLDDEIAFYIGTNRSDNFAVIDKGSPNDLWFHANEISSCHVVAILPNYKISKEIMHQIIVQGCLLCKENTNKLKGEKKVSFIYTTISNINKKKTPGQVLTHDTKNIII
jgi:predicted ribosome quality control (RQC) complex YloA/Tae2 family protein